MPRCNLVLAISWNVSGFLFRWVYPWGELCCDFPSYLICRFSLLVDLTPKINFQQWSQFAHFAIPEIVADSGLMLICLNINTNEEATSRMILLMLATIVGNSWGGVNAAKEDKEQAVPGHCFSCLNMWYILFSVSLHFIGSKSRYANSIKARFHKALKKDFYWGRLCLKNHFCCCFLPDWSPNVIFGHDPDIWPFAKTTFKCLARFWPDLSSMDTTHIFWGVFFFFYFEAPSPIFMGLRPQKYIWIAVPVLPWPLTSCSLRLFSLLIF